MKLADTRSSSSVAIIPHSLCPILSITNRQPIHTLTVSFLLTLISFPSSFPSLPLPVHDLHSTS